MNCPKCQAAMELITFEGVTVDRCTACKGIWFDANEQKLLKEMGTIITIQLRGEGVKVRICERGEEVFDWRDDEKAPGVVILSLEGSPLASPMRIRAAGNNLEIHQIRKTWPVYPPLAKQAMVQGTVRLSILIGTDGTVQKVQVLSMLRLTKLSSMRY